MDRFAWGRWFHGNAASVYCRHNTPEDRVMAKKKSPTKAAPGKTAAKPDKPPVAAHADGAPGIDIGISTSDRRKIADGLSHFLADAFTLYLKTHNFHWNITGPMFNSLHLMFETQYNELALAVDLIAERIRALDMPAPGSYSQFSKLSSIKEETGVPDWKEMVKQLVEGQEAVVRTARKLFPAVDAAHDEPTADLLTQRMQVHEKNAWMLRALLN
jgi:starvation-inducible DNA-binding protein